MGTRWSTQMDSKFCQIKFGYLKTPKYNPQNIDKALKRMEDADNLKGIHRSGTNIMSFFDDNDEEHELQKKQSAAEVKKDEYLKSV